MAIKYACCSSFNTNAKHLIRSSYYCGYGLCIWLLIPLLAVVGMETTLDGNNHWYPSKNIYLNLERISGNSFCEYIVYFFFLFLQDHSLVVN